MAPIEALFRTWNLWPQIEAAVRTMPGRAAGHGPLSVLSGGCGTGLEPYSAALLLAELGRDFNLTAIDSEPANIEQAASGLIPLQAVRTAQREGILDAQMIRRHLSREPEGYRLSPALLERITFRVGDLNAPSDLFPESLDIALVRNVWRHLHPHGRAALAAELHARMHAHGVLVLGGSDFLWEYPPGESRRVGHRLKPYPEWTEAVREDFTEWNRCEFIYLPKSPAGP